MTLEQTTAANIQGRVNACFKPGLQGQIVMQISRATKIGIDLQTAWNSTAAGNNFSQTVSREVYTSVDTASDGGY